MKSVLTTCILLVASALQIVEAQITTSEVTVMDTDDVTTITGDLNVTGHVSDNGMKLGVSAINSSLTIDMNDYEGNAWEVVGIRHLWSSDPTTVRSRTVKYIVTLKPWTGTLQTCHIDLIGGNTTGWGGGGNTASVTTDATNCTLTTSGSQVYWFYKKIH